MESKLSKSLFQIALLFVVGSFLAGCSSNLPPGNISGKVMYEDLTNGGSAEPMANVMIVLCRVPSEGLPEGPVVSTSNRDEIEHICTLQGVPTALTDADGAFTVDGVPPGTYLVIFHQYSAEVEAQVVEWNGVALMEASWNDVDGVEPSGASDFWEDGGNTLAISNWSARVGTTVSRGNVCSKKFGFCFSIREECPHPVIEVKSDETVEVELIAHFKTKE